MAHSLSTTTGDGAVLSSIPFQSSEAAEESSFLNQPQGRRREEGGQPTEDRHGEEGDHEEQPVVEAVTATTSPGSRVGTHGPPDDEPHGPVPDGTPSYQTRFEITASLGAPAPLVRSRVP